MSALHPSARNSCKKAKTTKKTAQRKKPTETQAQHKVFMAISAGSFFGIGRDITCEKKAVAYARSQRKGDDGKINNDVTVGIVRGGVCVFAEGPHAKHFLRSSVELN